MKAQIQGIVVALLLVLFTHPSTAKTVYVDANGANPTPPFTNWATAATVIQDAVDAAAAGDEVLVTNGVYATGGRAVVGTMTNRVAVDKALTLRSVKGPEVTVIQGYQVPVTTNGNGAIRCVYLVDGAILNGFTLTQGATCVFGNAESDFDGGGVWCVSTNAMVTNCIFAGNSACAFGGGAYGGTLNNCVLRGNEAANGGGAASATLSNCTLTGNTALGGGGAGHAVLNNCVLSNNSASEFGGGVWGLSVLNNCILTGNSAWAGGAASEVVLSNCILTSNSASAYGGGANYCRLNNCSLFGNSAGNHGGGANYCDLTNSILYYNTAPTDPNYDSGTLDYCCTAPLPTNGEGNFNKAPSFRDATAGDYRLRSDSPCINAGNNACVTSATDLDGNARIVGGSVDIGAYEFQAPTSLLSYAWLQQYGLPTDGSADIIDSDDDGANNWQEWQAGTVPTNTMSALRLMAPLDGPSGVAVSWLSVSNRTYFVERSTSLVGAPAFQTIATGVSGNIGTTTFVDTNAPASTPGYYRVGTSL